MVIRAVIFDFGGVILRTEDHTPREQLAARLGMPVNELYRLVFDNQTARLATIGKVSTESHWESVRETMGKSQEQFRAIQTAFWEGDRIDAALIDTIRSLRLRWKTGLLSNAWDNLHALLNNYWKIADVFDEIIISAEEGVAKPDPRIYQIAVDKLGVLPAEAVFIDDSTENIQAASTFGMNAIQFKNLGQVQLELAGILEDR